VGGGERQDNVLGPKGAPIRAAQKDRKEEGGNRLSSWASCLLAGC